MRARVHVRPCAGARARKNVHMRVRTRVHVHVHVWVCVCVCVSVCLCVCVCVCACALACACARALFGVSGVESVFVSVTGVPTKCSTVVICHISDNNAKFDMIVQVFCIRRRIRNPCVQTCSHRGDPLGTVSCFICSLERRLLSLSLSLLLHM
jgi:hypothetical protein